MEMGKHYGTRINRSRCSQRFLNRRDTRGGIRDGPAGWPRRRTPGPSRAGRSVRAWLLSGNQRTVRPVCALHAARADAFPPRACLLPGGSAGRWPYLVRRGRLLPMADRADSPAVSPAHRSRMGMGRPRRAAGQVVSLGRRAADASGPAIRTAGSKDPRASARQRPTATACSISARTSTSGVRIGTTPTTTSLLRSKTRRVPLRERGVLRGAAPGVIRSRLLAVPRAAASRRTWSIRITASGPLADRPGTRPRSLLREDQHVLMGQVVELAFEVEAGRFDFGRKAVAVEPDVFLQPLGRHVRVRPAAVKIDDHQAAAGLQALCGCSPTRRRDS